MTTTDFKPINCRRCGALVWEGVSWAGFARRLATPVLTIEEEVVKRISGLMTYEAHRTMVSFEAVERSLNRIQWASASKSRIILADHQCSHYHLFETEPPNYWPQIRYEVKENVPF